MGYLASRHCWLCCLDGDRVLNMEHSLPWIYIPLMAMGAGL